MIEGLKMSKEYAMSRVKDALEQSDGNHMKAARLLTEWLENDNSLYYGLTAPHMRSIVTHAIAHVDKKPAAEVQANIQAAPDAPKATDAEMGELGQAILSGMTSKTGSYGEDNPGGKGPGKASQTHVDALKAMSDAYKENKN